MARLARIPHFRVPYKGLGIKLFDFPADWIGSFAEVISDETSVILATRVLERVPPDLVRFSLENPLAAQRLDDARTQSALLFDIAIPIRGDFYNTRLPEAQCAPVYVPERCRACC